MKRDNLKKKDILKLINKNTGMPILYLNNFFDNILLIINDLLNRDKILKIKDFGTFKVSKKLKREGRNPKNKAKFIIKERNVLTFKASNNFNKKINYDKKI